MPLYIDGAKYVPYVDGVEVDVVVDDVYYHKVNRVKEIKETLKGWGFEIDSGDKAYARFKFTNQPLEIKSVSVSISQSSNSAGSKIQPTTITPNELMSKANTTGFTIYLGYYSDKSFNFVTKNQNKAEYISRYFNAAYLDVVYTCKS